MSSQDYHVVQRVTADGGIPITQYVNKVTGLTIFIASVEWPIVKGDFMFATEAFDDDGLPHTLEHLVFLGSEEYPFKGVLDLLANKCLADGTNAYTDTDHTCYTISTAGSDGFLSFMPIYLDHLLFPTLTDAGYVTEVHHINGDGEDAGVVYCEIQAIENTGESRVHLEMLRSLYPGKSGYKSETGGSLENLRTSTNVDKCREYHKKFYHTKNMALVIVGPVDPEEVFKAIKPVEDKVVARKMHEIEFDRPWQTPVEPLLESVSRKIKYSSETDDDGLVNVGFRGPSSVQCFKELVALSIILDYLTSTPISPIQRDFVECSEPYCSSVSFSIIENSVSCFYISFESVGKQYLDLVEGKLFTLLGNIVSGQEKMDMDRMRVILARKIVKILSSTETSPHSVVVGSITGHFLYGEGNLAERCEEIPVLKEFMKLDSKFWTSCIENYMTGAEARHVCIVGEPCPAMMEEMSAAEQKRLEVQKEKLKEVLPEYAENLRKSKEFNEIPPPNDFFCSIPSPSPDNIKFHSIERHVLEGELPFRLQYDNIKTNFVRIHLLLNTSDVLTIQERLYLPLLSEILLESSIERDGRVVPHEDIVAQIYSDTIEYSASIGIHGGSCYSVGAIGMLFSLAFQVEVGKYDKAIQWCKEILFQTVFTEERIKTIATRLISDISQYKRSGTQVTSAALNAIIFRKESNQWATNFMRQRKFLKGALKDLALTKMRLEGIRVTLAQPQNILVHIAADGAKMNTCQVYNPWKNLLSIEVCPTKVIDIKKIPPCHELVQLAERPKAAIVGVGSVESNFLVRVIKSINSPQDPELAPVLVLIQYLTQLEGPMWRQIRGSGLSYSYTVDLSPSNGIMKLSLYRASHVVAAYKKAAEIVYRCTDGTDEFEGHLLESAKSTLIFECISHEKSPASRSMQSLIAHLRDLDINFSRDLIKKIAKVTIEDLRRVGPRYLKPLFSDAENRTVVCCHPSKVQDIVKNLGDLGCQLEIIKLDEEPTLNSLD